MRLARGIKSAVVTGPTGAIGTALCRLLVGRGLTVHAIVRPKSKRAQHLRDIHGLRIVECDMSMLGSLAERVPSADAFFHLGWAHTTGPGRNDMHVQVRNIRYVIDACLVARELGCSVFVGAGSQAEYGMVDGPMTAKTPCYPQTGYGMAKLCAGQMGRVECEKWGIDFIWPRILSVYGPYDAQGSMISSVATQLLRGERPQLTAGEQLWDYLFAEDAAQALYDMALNGRAGAVYPLGSGVSRPLKVFIEEMRDAIDPNLSLGFGEIPYAANQVMCLKADISALTCDTGFVPRVSFHEGIRRTIGYLRERSGD